MVGDWQPVARTWLERPDVYRNNGGSVGYQIGGSSTDLVMLFMNDHALQSLLSDKFKLGADASVAAGRGRNAAAGTDVKLSAEICLFAHQRRFRRRELGRAVVQADKSGDKAMYGDDVDRHEILSGKVAVPASAQALLTKLVDMSGKPSSKLNFRRRRLNFPGLRRRGQSAEIVRSSLSWQSPAADSWPRAWRLRSNGVVKELRCDYAQGYYLAKPLPAEQACVLSPCNL